jgi:hypothetical protein
MVFVLGITGCGDGGTDKAMKERIQAMFDLAEAMNEKNADKVQDAEKKISDADAILEKADTKNLQYAYLNNQDELGRARNKINAAVINSTEKVDKGKFLRLAEPKWETKAKPVVVPSQ